MSKERQESCKAAIEKVSLFVIPSLHFYVYMYTFLMYTGIRVFHYFFSHTEKAEEAQAK